MGFRGRGACPRLPSHRVPMPGTGGFKAERLVCADVAVLADPFTTEVKTVVVAEAFDTFGALGKAEAVGPGKTTVEVLFALTTHVGVWVANFIVRGVAIVDTFNADAGGWETHFIASACARAVARRLTGPAVSDAGLASVAFGGREAFHTPPLGATGFSAVTLRVASTLHAGGITRAEGGARTVAVIVVATLHTDATVLVTIASVLA